jgi:HK97 family phage major capsid protein
MSLAAIDAKISTKRRALAEAIEARKVAFAQTDAASEAIDALQAKSELTADEQSALDKQVAAHKAARQEAFAVADKINALQSEVADLESERSARQVAIAQEANAGQAPQRQVAPEPFVVDASKVRVAEPSKEQIDADIGAWLRNQYVAKHFGTSVRAVCAGEFGAQYTNDRLRAAVDSTATPSLLPVNYGRRLIELLRPASVITSLPGVRSLPLLNGNLTMPRQSAAATANYTAEMANIATSEPDTDSIVLSAKKLTAMVIASGEMLRRSDPSADAMIRDDMIQVVGLKKDVTFLRNTANLTTTPKGLKYFADQDTAAGVVVSNQTVNLANVTSDLGKVILKLRNVNTPFRNPVWILSPRSERFLMDLRDGNGNIAFPEMERGMLRQFPYRVSTQVPDNLTTDAVTECSEIYFVDASEILIGDTPTYELQVSTEAAYHDGTNIQASFSQDAAVFRLITEHDLQLRHTRSVAMLSKVIWGK